MYRISIVHNFETAHRLADPRSPSKCQSIHGHSWWATVYVEGAVLDDQGMLVEFGHFKKLWRGFLDDEVDHYLAVQAGDPVIAALRAAVPDLRILVLPFAPSTENLARWLHERATEVLAQAAPHRDDLRISKVHLQETRVNAAEFEPLR